MSLKTLAGKAKKKITGQDSDTKSLLATYYNRFERFSYTDCRCENLEQFEASITRLYHTIEKGLSYENYRAGFGKDNVDKLITSLEQFAGRGFDTDSFCYRTGLSCLEEYIKKNREHGFSDAALEKRIGNLPGSGNGLGGVITVSAPEVSDLKEMPIDKLMTSRHSIRHFSGEPVDIEKLKEALKLAQHTPSACNRQCWKTRIVADKAAMEQILANQNGNRGFGQEIDKLLVITADLRAQQKNRELFQAYIDGGMYAESVLNSLYYYGIGAIPLSASLKPDQEENVRKAAGIDDAEVLILIIGVGNYPKECLTTRSERREAQIEIIS